MTQTEPDLTQSIPSFAGIGLSSEQPAAPAAAGGPSGSAAAVTGELASAHGYSVDQVTWNTPEQIDVTPVYTRAERDAVLAWLRVEPPFRRRARLLKSSQV